ncbi:hypothetical protein D3C86_1938280 [compost metagenome]
MGQDETVFPLVADHRSQDSRHGFGIASRLLRIGEAFRYPQDVDEADDGVSVFSLQVAPWIDSRRG